MAYTLEAFLAAPAPAADLAAAVGSVAVPLGHGLALVPLPAGSDPDGAAQQAAGIIGGGLVAYVEAEYFGGVGEQSAVLWRDGVREELGSINEALRALGVRGIAGRDEFDTVDLGRHRSTQDWLTPR